MDDIRRRAITSYGIIPCAYDADGCAAGAISRAGYTCGAKDDLCVSIQRCGTWRFLIAQRRDTIAYSEFIKARIPPVDLVRYGGLMTRAERRRIAQFPFQQLWHDFWIHVDNRLYHSEYARCAGAFDSNARIIAEGSEAGLDESPWGFPKGRKCPGETDLDCALREFEEETRIDRRALHMMAGAPILHEYYQGSDHRWYRTVYYMCLLTYYPSVPILSTPHHIRKMTVTEEIGSLMWADVGEAFGHMDVSRRRVVRAAHQFLMVGGQGVSAQAHRASMFRNVLPASAASASASASASVPGPRRWFSTFLRQSVPHAPV